MLQNRLECHLSAIESHLSEMHQIGMTVSQVVLHVLNKRLATVPSDVARNPTMNSFLYIEKKQNSDKLFETILVYKESETDPNKVMMSR